MKRLSKWLRSIADKIDPQEKKNIPPVEVPERPLRKFVEYDNVVPIMACLTIPYHEYLCFRGAHDERFKWFIDRYKEEAIRGCLGEARKYIEVSDLDDVDGQLRIQARLYLYKKKEEK